MKKWMFLVAVAVAAVIAVGVYYFVSPESNDYSGSSNSADCTMNITNDSFEIVLTEYSDNSYLTTRSIYSGRVNSSQFTVNSYTVQYCEFGKVYKETAETGMSIPLGDMVFFRDVTGGYLVKDTFIKRTINNSDPSLLCVTTQEAIDSSGYDITLVKGSTYHDIAGMTIVEIYGDGTSCRYPVDAKRIADVDYDTVGVRTVTIGYGDGKVANLTMSIVPFTVERNEIMNRGTSFEYAQASGKIVLDKGDGIGYVNVSGWDSSDGSRRVWLSYGDYSTSIVTTFTSDYDRTVKNGSIGMDHYTKYGAELPVFSIRMELNNGRVYEVQSDDPQVEVSGYDKNVLGPQAVRIGYSGSQFDVVIYSYDNSNLITKEAHLINVNKLYDSKDSLLLYTSKGLDYGNYAIRNELCDGSVRNIPLTQDMVEFEDELDTSTHMFTWAVIRETIGTYRYYETVTVMYDWTEEEIKASLTYARIIGDGTSAYYTMETANGTYVISFGYRLLYGEFYVAHNLVTSSSYLSTNVRYTHADEDSFRLYLSKDHSLDMERSILYGSELVRYYIDYNDVKYAEFSLVMTAEDIDFFSGFGFRIGDTVTLTVTYDGENDVSTAMDISMGGTELASGTFVYGAGVILSDEVEDYVNNIGTISVIMKFDDGREDHSYHVNIGIMDLSFECDDDHGVYLKKGNEFVPFEMPPIGITTTTEMYYLESEDTEMF